MRSLKFALALALFMTSISFESQIISTKNGLDSSWTVSIQTSNEAFADMSASAELQAAL